MDYTKNDEAKITQQNQISTNNASIVKINKELLALSKGMVPLTIYNKLDARIHHNFEKVSYALTDLKNLIMTTDVYIDKFLPFRLNKEMSNFLQFVVPEE